LPPLSSALPDGPLESRAPGNQRFSGPLGEDAESLTPTRSIRARARDDDTVMPGLGGRVARRARAEAKGVGMAETGLPFEIREAVVQVCGRTFWLKDPLRAFLLAAGVPSPLYERYEEESKYKIARHVL